MSRPVWITAATCLTPHGSTDNTFQAVLAGEAGFEPYVEPGYEGRSIAVGKVDMADKKVRGVRQPRARVLARQALGELPDRCHQNLDALIVGTALGATKVPIQALQSHLTEGRRLPPWFVPHGMTNSVSAGLAIDLEFNGRLQQLAGACASGAAALAAGAELVRFGIADNVLVIASDAIPHWTAVQGFADLQAMSDESDPRQRPSRPFDQTRSGFVLSEGAAAIHLSSDQAGGPQVEHIASAQTNDAHSFVAPEPDGAYAKEMLAVLANQTAPGDILVSAHGTSTPLNDEREARVIDSEIGSRARVTAFKGALGHSMGACGLIETVLAIEALKAQVVPPITGLVDPIPTPLRLTQHSEGPQPNAGTDAICESFGFGGQNCGNLIRIHRESHLAG